MRAIPLDRWPGAGAAEQVPQGDGRDAAAAEQADGACWRDLRVQSHRRGRLSGAAKYFHACLCSPVCHALLLAAGQR